MNPNFPRTSAIHSEDRAPDEANVVKYRNQKTFLNPQYLLYLPSLDKQRLTQQTPAASRTFLLSLNQRGGSAASRKKIGSGLTPPLKVPIVGSSCDRESTGERGNVGLLYQTERRRGGRSGVRGGSPTRCPLPITAIHAPSTSSSRLRTNSIPCAPPKENQHTEKGTMVPSTVNCKQQHTGQNTNLLQERAPDLSAEDDGCGIPIVKYSKLKDSVSGRVSHSSGEVDQLLVKTPETSDTTPQGLLIPLVGERGFLTGTLSLVGSGTEKHLQPHPERRRLEKNFSKQENKRRERAMRRYESYLFAMAQIHGKGVGTPKEVDSTTSIPSCMYSPTSSSSAPEHRQEVT